jgi:ABC-type transport system substrate-binding protein
MKKILGAAMLALTAAALPASGAFAQAAPRDTLVALRSIDADNYDPHRSTARSNGEVMYMMADTLVSLDWDMKTIRPGLAESWSVSEDGKTYTFRLRRDVTFCNGKKMTAADVAYSISRWVDPATRSPVRWRAGNVKEVRAVDDYTVEYELNEPFGELLYQLTLFFASVIDKENVEALGANFGVQGFNGTGPYCWESWTPRQQMTLRRHAGYTWGPPIYQNPSPQVERVIWRVIPESNTRLAALQSGQGDVTQYIPHIAVAQLQRLPTVQVTTQPNYLWDYFFGFKVDKPVVSDPAIRRAANMAVNREAVTKAAFFTAAQPMNGYINPAALGYDSAASSLLPGHDPEAARKLLEEAGWRAGADGIRVKDGLRASFSLYGIQDQVNRQIAEAIQADLRRVGIEMKIQLWDATVAWGKLATQEFDSFIMSYPYVSATDGLALYFDGSNRPTPNRMNWNDDATNVALRQARGGLTQEERNTAIGQVQRIVTEANTWIPVAHENLYLAASQRVQGARAHGIYGVALYKGLDIRLTR